MLATYSALSATAAAEAEAKDKEDDKKSETKSTDFILNGDYVIDIIS